MRECCYRENGFYGDDDVNINKNKNLLCGGSEIHSIIGSLKKSLGHQHLSIKAIFQEDNNGTNVHTHTLTHDMSEVDKDKWKEFHIYFVFIDNRKGYKVVAR